MADKFGNEINVGDIISDGFNAAYTIKEANGELVADNGGHMFPLRLSNYNMQKFKRLNNK